MERRPFTIKQRMTLKSVLRALPFIVGFLVALFIIGRETGGLITIFLMFVTFIFFGASYVLTDPRYKAQALLRSPCPKCGQSPMRYEISSKGDYVFICDKCQIEWTLDAPPWRHQ
jgi:hypothetical protein